MGRNRKFSRDGVLEKAVPVFWKHGFAGTTVQDLEQATGVNKSGLYAEFENKEELFLASLDHYLKTRRRRDLLTAEPLGWQNVQDFLETAPCGTGDRKGCFSVNSVRELAYLPKEARKMVKENREGLKDLIRANVAAETPGTDPAAITEMISVFFSGMCVEANLDSDPEKIRAKVRAFMHALRAL